METGSTEGRPRRVDVRVPVELLCSKGIRLTGKTRNVSEGGMFVETALLLPVGSPVRCDLALDESSIEVLGRIAWSRPRQPLAAAGMGIQFVGYEDGARRALHEVVVHGVPVPRLVPPEVTARIRRARDGRMIVAAVFAVVATATAGIVLAILPSRSAALPAEPRVASAGRMPIAAAAIETALPGEEEEAQEQEEVVAPVVDIIPRRDGTTAVMMPIAGDVAVRHFPLADPDGVALFFDDGRTTAELTNYRHPDGSVHKVWVGAEGREVRIFTRGTPPRYRVDRFERTLRVLFDPPATDVSR